MKRAHRQARDLLYAAIEKPEGELRRVVKLAIVLLGPSGKRSKAKPRSAATKARRASVKELDALCRAIVFVRDEQKCARCGRPAVDWSHVYSRRYKWLRWDLDNSVASCKGCHLLWHHKPLEGVEWVKKHLGPERYERLQQRAARPSRVNLVAVRAYLEKEARALGIEVGETPK